MLESQIVDVRGTCASLIFFFFLEWKDERIATDWCFLYFIYPFILWYVCVWGKWKYITCMQELGEVNGAVWCPETDATGRWERACRLWELNICHLQEKLVLLNTEPSLQFLFACFIRVTSNVLYYNPYL